MTGNETNLYDISVEASVALGDLLELNPGLQAGTIIAPATQLAHPCYASDAPTYFGAHPLHGYRAVCILCLLHLFRNPPSFSHGGTGGSAHGLSVKPPESCLKASFSISSSWYPPSVLLAADVQA